MSIGEWAGGFQTGWRRWLPIRVSSDTKKSCAGWYTSDHLDLEVEAREPVDPKRGPARVGGAVKYLALNGHNGIELLFGVGMKRHDIEDIVESAPRCEQRRFQVGKR